MDFVFTNPTIITWTGIAALSGIQRHQLLIHCRNYTGERTYNAADAFALIAEFSGDDPRTYDYLQQWQVVEVEHPGIPVFDAWIDVDHGTAFAADTTAEASTRMIDCNFRDTSGTPHGEEISAALDRAFKKAASGELPHSP
ncbi:hypothetical protein ABZS94_34850 [Streptomyces sp. NPDC005500]|uniref:hypothetical protein n=1 Tax=Streptomyces sp. NPDC005500 TaxID=3155007 RepID=UPI0033B3A4D3